VGVLDEFERQSELLVEAQAVLTSALTGELFASQSFEAV
jgi:hypothetical protein